MDTEDTAIKEEVNNYRNLTCVLFPGIVKNEERALECLGGVRHISKVHNEVTKKRLGLSFHPENPYVKKIFADHHKTAGLLMKVKVKKKRVGDKVQREVVSTDVLGRVSSLFQFDSLCDFQYLPMTTKEGADKATCTMDQLIPGGMDSFDWLKGPVPQFVVPANFTRSDKPHKYRYTDKRYGPVRNVEDEDIHQRTRVGRSLHCPRVVFSLVGDLPSDPHKHFIAQKASRMSSYPKLGSEFEVVKKMFDERPIWSKNAIQYNSKLSTSSLKVILPCVALYMRGGPWRMLWVRLGYDPRKEPTSRIYQTLDFRLRSFAGINSMVTTRDQFNQYKKVDRVKQMARKRYEDQFATEDAVAESTVYCWPGMIPTQRQTFYQYCDIKLPEVEALLGRLGEVPPGALCHERRGWLPPALDDQCRDVLFAHAKKALLANYKEGYDIKLETAPGSSDEEAESDEEGEAEGEGEGSMAVDAAQ